MVLAESEALHSQKREPSGLAWSTVGWVDRAVSGVGEPEGPLWTVWTPAEDTQSSCIRK